MKFFLTLGLLSVMFPWMLHAAELTLTEKDSGKMVILRKGDQLTVKLPANPTTGYSWDFHLPSDGVLNGKNSSFHSSDVTGNRAGAGGYEIWNFRAIKSGVARLVFSYARPWEKGIPPVRVFESTVTVNP